MSERLNTTKFLRLFERTAEQDRWVSSADAEEYLVLISYLVEPLESRKRRII